jgi:DNA-binding protein HU-beta
MTKHEFIDAVAEKAGLTKQDAAAAVDAALGVIETTLSNGDSITFTGFGKFHVTRRAARQGVNPRTGQRVAIVAANVPKFSAGSRLKLATNVGESGWASDVVGSDSEGNPIEPWRPRPRPRP